jgi:hypothetical protein
MTNAEIKAALVRARMHLRRTTQSGVEYRKTGKGSNWKEAYAEINRVIGAVEPPKVPSLGPVSAGGKSVLQHDLTHATSGIPKYPAFDDAFVEGRAIMAPEFLTVTRDSSSRPGDAFYAEGRSGLRYWFGHLASAPPVGAVFAKGAVVGKVGPNSVGGGPHVHVGINIEKRYGAGKELAHHTNYTHGAPTVGDQLATLEGR